MNERYLPSTLRRTLERVIKDARIAAEDGARDAIRRLGVAESKAPSYLAEPEEELWRCLRAHGRALGDEFYHNYNTQETKHLIEATAYAHWHRMLFARFLAERGLLRNPEYDVSVSLEDCRELAEAEGIADPWTIAEKYAAQMLPAVFRVDDPVLALEFDSVYTQKLQKLVKGLEAEVFEAEDSLGWTYQFWRAAEKDAINASGVKIGADELPAVTQLFTEPYMVRFLLHNTLGAWWAGMVFASNPTLAETATDESELREACALANYSFEMLRFVRDGEDGLWKPAAGTFSGWPMEAKDIKMLDPCCGSGHFLTEALAILAAIRQAEEQVTTTDAVSSVLRDNLHGLEIDGRCVQIAAFAVALSAWRIGGWQMLPLPNIAWVGAPPPLPRQEFISLADGDKELEYVLSVLHELFTQASVLGTLIGSSGGDLFEAKKLKEMESFLEPMLTRARKSEPERREGVIAARGMVDAASLLSARYTIQFTNVPFLGRAKQCKALVDYLDRRFDKEKFDLATAMLSRMSRLSAANGTYSAITPQNWFFLGRYKRMRVSLLRETQLNVLAALGSRAFETISGEVVNTGIIALTNSRPQKDVRHLTIDANPGRDHLEKAEILVSGDVSTKTQSEQSRNPDSRLTTGETSLGIKLLQDYAISKQGVVSGDRARLVRYFWEVPEFGDRWRTFQSTPSITQLCSGKNYVIDWTQKDEMPWPRVRNVAYGKSGVAFGQIGRFSASIYDGDIYDNNTGVIVPISDSNFPALWAYCSSPEFHDEVRKIDQKMNVTNATFLKVPFDKKRWSQEAARLFPKGIPRPYSDDPTQWVFHGHPARAMRGTALHIALARLAGYRWPAEVSDKMCLSKKARNWIKRTAALPDGDNDSFLGLPAVAGEKPLADRLRAYLAAAFGAEWSDDLERRLVAEADETLDKKVARNGSLEAWLRDRAFRQHCALFGQRPFLWQISDGLKDSFSVFIHYHRFGQAALRKLAYTLLGEWLTRAAAEENTLRYEKGRELQQKLEAILEGKEPFDIFVRWKSLGQQPLGWNPDLDDGVRQNIRPFILAGVLTHKLDKILKDKDRGKDVSSAPWFGDFKGERRNDHHTALAEKRAAREDVAKRLEASR